MNNFSKKLLAGAIAAVSVLVATPAASAAARDGRCDSGEFCLYWGPDSFGSLSDFTTSIDTYGTSQPTCYEYRTAGQPGFQDCVKNNAMSACNKRSRAVRVYFNSYHEGAYDTIPAGRCQNLVNTENENASHLFL
ncbi:peptidase inhibitor family I36 protein [Lentzea albida]|uniref:Peptidase inhibitor family I36 n=1 Tax=Lentzea albida TaxID=65499 RepID=A0A1H9NH75_9PSEU|nr:peptidase inhibitor family I36 protein [Lentzea albida]SER35238.1 hypothetical protein SAMN04488000_108149 [Lentzea albida]